MAILCLHAHTFGDIEKTVNAATGAYYPITRYTLETLNYNKVYNFIIFILTVNLACAL